MKTRIFLVLSVLALISAATSSPVHAAIRGSHTYQCGNHPRSSGAEPAFVVTATVSHETSTALVEVVVDGERTSAIAEVTFAAHSTFGRSRCPGSWTGIELVSTSGAGPFKSLSIIRNHVYVSCRGAMPRDAVGFEVDGQSNEFHPLCREIAPD